jgi:serine O-acetyltransferase
MTTTQLIRSDLVEMRRALGSWRYVVHPPVLACVLYRLAHAAARHGRAGRIASQLLTVLNMLLTGSEIHANARIGPRLRIPHAVGVVVGSGVVAGEQLTLYGSTNLGAASMGGPFPTLGDRVVLGAKASVLGGVRVGSDVNVGAHAVVLSDVPDGHTAVGVPARSRIGRRAG